MASSLKATLLGLSFLCAAGIAAADSGSATIRLLSFAVRDQPPALDEVQAYRAGQKSLDDFVSAWLGTPAHQDRIRRFFNDMFGVRASIFVFDSELGLTRNAAGAYYLPSKGNCSPADEVTVQPWWLEPGQAIAICKTSNSSVAGFTDASGNVVSCLDIGNGLPNAACGCGPSAILCYPVDLYSTILASVRQEAQERGLYAYQNGLSWLDFIGGDYLWANRYLAYYYAYEQGLLWGTAVDPGVIAAIEQVPTASWARTVYPAGAERAGMITAPGFLKQYNNYRARVRGLAQKLLCQDVDATLNVDAYATYLNPDFTAFDKSHGLKAGCAGCHYPMDNLGSALFNYGSEGEYSFDTPQPLSQLGHAFGQDVRGPRALARAFIERAPGFTTCIARTAWEGLSGGKWSDLTASDQSVFTALVGQGPRALLQGILKSGALRNARSTGGSAPGNGSGIPFAQVAPIVAAACSGGGCHSQGSPQTNFVDNEASFRLDGNNVASRIVLGGGAGAMPPLSSGKTLTPADRDAILSFLGKR